MVAVGPALGAVAIALAVYSGNLTAIAFAVACFTISMVFTAATLFRS